MRSFDLTTTLYKAAKTVIALTGAAHKETNINGPTGVGISRNRPSTVAKTLPAKYSAAAKILDKLLIEKKINAADLGDAVYVEVEGVKCIATDRDANFADAGTLHGTDKLIPPIMYMLRNSAKNELSEVFVRIRDSYLKTGTVDNADILQFCDSFYYSYAKSQKTYDFDDGFSASEIDASLRSGLLSPMNVFKGIADLPAMSFTTAETKAEATTKKATDPFEEVKSGTYLVSYDWDEEQKTKIPALSTLDSFVPSEAFYSLTKKIKTRMDKVILRMDGGMEGVDAIGKDFINSFAVGKPGTGKTTMAYALGAATGLPVYTIAMTKNTEEDTFQGMTKVIDGKLTFADTDFLKAYEHGGIIVLEEINLPDPAVIMGSIGQAIEYPFVLMKNGFETVRRHPLCVIIGTMNVGTYGSKGVNQALSSRFKQTYMLNDPSKNDFINILMKNGYKKAICTWVYNAYDKVIKFLKSPSISADDIALTVTLRGCLGALENMEEGEDPKTAIKNTLVGKIAEADLELAEKVYAEINCLPDITF